MRLGMVGLGRMGGNMAERLLRHGHHVVGHDLDPEVASAASQRSIEVAPSLEEVVARLAAPRTVWLMLPAGDPTETTVAAVSELLQPGDLLVDGGNSNYKDTLRRGAHLQLQGIEYADVGTSGGIWGLAEGYCLMVGASPQAFQRLTPLLQSLAAAPDRGYGHVGPPGAGHFVKMVHNGVEYGLMEAYAEGFELLKAKGEFNLNLAQIAQIWRSGSVIRSWLLDITAEMLSEDQELTAIQAFVEDTGEGRWAVEEAVDLALPLPIISLALQARFRSRQAQPYGARLLAAMRRKFGGHPVRTT